MTKHLHTLTGPVNNTNLGIILPHEHIFVDLRGPNTPDYGQANADDVIALMKPHIDAAWDAGVRIFMECTPPGVGRNISILRKVAEKTPMRIIVPTGVYRDELTPTAMRNLGVGQLSDFWIRELLEGIEDTTIRAGFIKIAMSDDGPREIEIRNLQAAALASRETGAVIASHTTNGAILQNEIEVLINSHLDIKRFIWVHANAEPNLDYHTWAASRGAYIEIDGVCSRLDLKPFKAQADMVMHLIDTGFVDQILLSHDAGWYAPGQPGGHPSGGVRGFTALITEFIPYLLDLGVAPENIEKITEVNPFKAFAF